MEAILVVLDHPPPRPVALHPPAVALPAHHQAVQSDLPHPHLAVLQLPNLHQAVLHQLVYQAVLHQVVYQAVLHQVDLQLTHLHQAVQAVVQARVRE